ncbi:hypothetical protein HYX19_04020 [Candidatus Woesearchaeota archaeon]|nr:hypothetical protein [Candidatus Woesearchaeota archaeon]
MKHNRGQAAMEFLMTYGWAILVVLAAIGALAYFGVLSPSRFLPSSCTIAPGIGCDEFKVTPTTVQLLLRNGMGNDLTSATIAIATCTTSSAASWTDGSVLGGTSGTTLSGCTNGAVGSRYKQSANVTYTLNGVSHTKTGQIVSLVE